MSDVQVAVRVKAVHKFGTLMLQIGFQRRAGIEFFGMLDANVGTGESGLHAFGGEVGDMG